MIFNEGKRVMTEAETECLRDTQDHIEKVRSNLGEVTSNLITRGNVHDASKLQSAEFEVFSEYGPKLKGSTYGSDEYKQNLKEMKVALDHHYANNTHHPEHYPNGIQDMSLLDIIEMIADWKAAVERHDNGDFAQSFITNYKRFKIPFALFWNMLNTTKELGWLTEEQIERVANECDL